MFIKKESIILIFCNSEEKIMRTWKTNVRLPNGSHQDVFVQADCWSNARAMIEALYGRGSIFSGPWSMN
jgi:hypothetical protein